MAAAVVGVVFVGFVVFMAYSRRISAYLARRYREEQERRRRQAEREAFERACRDLGQAMDNLAHAFVVSFTPAVQAFADTLNGLADALRTPEETPRALSS